MKVLEMLYKIGIADSIDYIEKDSEHARLLEKAVSEEEKYWKELSEDGKKAYDEHGYITGEINTLLKCEAFVQGFRLGARVILEVLGKYQIDEFNVDELL